MEHEAMLYNRMLKRNTNLILNRVTQHNIDSLQKEFLHLVKNVHPINCLNELEYLLNIMIEYIINTWINLQVGTKIVYFYQYCDLIGFLLNQTESSIKGAKLAFARILNDVCHQRCKSIKRERRSLQYFAILVWIVCTNKCQ